MLNEFLGTFLGFWFLFIFIELIWRSIIIIRFSYIFYESNQSMLNLAFDFVASVMWPVKVNVKDCDDNIHGAIRRYSYLVTMHYVLLMLAFGLFIFGIIHNMYF